MDLDKVSTTNIFPTNIITYLWPNIEELNKDLVKMVLAESKKTESLQISNAGGYHSPNDLLTWDYPCITTFVDMIQEMTEIMAQRNGLKEGHSINLSFAAWSNIMSNGNHHTIHCHPNNFWSGCYYIQDGNPDRDIKYNGHFEFKDPRVGAQMITSDSINCLQYQLIPQPGLMVMFPSYVDHFVHPHVGNGNRITIAFNVRII